VSHTKDYAELTEKSKNATQIIFKMPESFMKRFDETSEMLGYTRTEAIKEAIRRFQEQNEQKIQQRPENAQEMMKQMMSSIFSPLVEMAKAEETAKTIKALPKKD
jgi:metal-responsive CopG/Arc/MetJ family transcriptional regulator